MVVEVSVVRDGVDGLHYDAVHPETQRRGQAVLSEVVAALSHLIFSNFINESHLLAIRYFRPWAAHENELMKRIGEEDACHEGEVGHELVAVHDDVGVAENDDHLLIRWHNRIRTGNESEVH